MTKINTQLIKNIIISRTDKIGDLILSIPAFVHIKQMFPQARVMVLVRSYNQRILANMPFIDQLVCTDEYESQDLQRLIKDFRADMFIALFSNSFIAKLARVSGAKYRIGPLSKISSFFSYNCGLRQKRSQSIKNEAEYNLDLVKKIDPSLFDKYKIQSYKIAYTKSNENNIKDFLQNLGLLAYNQIKPFILINPFTGASAKNLTISEYLKVIENIKKLDNNLNIVLIAPTNNDYEQIYKAATYLKCPIFKGTADILDLCCLIDKCSLYIGASTGPSHIAGNLNKKCFCFYPNKATQHPKRWGLFLNEQNTRYFIVDQKLQDKDYNNLAFYNVDDSMLSLIAQKILEFYYAK